MLATQSPYTFVWHDNSGQRMPDHDAKVQSTVDTSGFTLNISPKTKLSDPVIIINSAATQNNAGHTINVGALSEVQIIEYMMSDDQNARNEAATVINCADGSIVKHCILQQASAHESIAQQATTTVNQQSNSNVESNVFSFGGGTNKVTLNFALRGANASCRVANLAYTCGNEKQEVLFNIEHIQAQCTSSSINRGVLKDKSSTDFIGRITVQHGAKQTVADLQIKNLLCSPKAQATNRPELEIYDDDVKCSHGSSTGQLDQDALFYMRSRGIDLQQASEMLIAGFIQPAITSCKIPTVVDYVQKLVAER